MLAFSQLLVFAQQNAGFPSYSKTTSMIPMRDGIKLFTTIYVPKNVQQPLPILMQRTPYGALDNNRSDIMQLIPYTANMAAEGYIFVYQDCRGKNKSEGTMEIHQPIEREKDKQTIDESTDTYDAIDWLVKNVPNNNGKVGIHGISYPGWLALVGAIHPHPALKAASPQAQMGDLYLGDDFHHNGAFRLSYGFEYAYSVEGSKEGEEFPFTQYDLFDWYLQLGSLKNVNPQYFKNRIPTWNRFEQHPDYDTFWQKNSPLNYMSVPEVPLLHVGGYYDQEDLLGPQLMYQALEKKDTKHWNSLVLGPWNHGQWAGATADSLGKIAFGSATAPWFQSLQKKWFDYWLKGIGNGQFAEAYAFQTGSNRWQKFKTWPPTPTKEVKLYAHTNGKASFVAPAGKDGAVQYISNPKKPVPYRTLPIEATYGIGSRWRSWHVEDQRFVYTRPDVVSFSTDSLTEALTITGSIKAHLQVSTSAADADWIVKLIDVYPDMTPESLSMSGYQLPVAMEVFRGRYRKSFSKPLPFTPNQPDSINIDLHQINHVFKKGHKLMIQIQSTWFPVIDINPQSWVPNIFTAKDADFIPATHRIYTNQQQATYISLPVVDNY